jgi:PilZ domain
MSGADPPPSTSTPGGETRNRRYPRLRCFVAVSLRAKNPDLFLMGNLSSIGLGGCGVETGNQVEIGVTVEIASFEDDRISVIGDVVNRRFLAEKPAFGVGIEFLDTSERKAAFIKFVEHKTQVDDQEYWYQVQMKRTEGEKP